jgi:peptidoglycan-associated lipoprotein
MKYFVWSWVALFLTGCSNGPTTTAWEETKTLGRYINRGTKALLKKETDSRLLDNPDELAGPVEDEFIPLCSDDLQTQTVDITVPQPKDLPTNRGTPIPGIEFFKEPSDRLAAIFRLVHFDTDKHAFTNNEYGDIVQKVSTYMKEHKNTYVFVLGHCDERASSAYNLALGTRRSNYVRTLLINKGVDANHVYTVSFGKELPIDPNHTRSAWAKNRRVEFKLYEGKPI